MPVTATVLFGAPQSEIASIIAQRLSASASTSIITGFATPGGVSAISAPVKVRPKSIAAIIVGAATYPGFQAIDELLAAGVPRDRMYVHLGHTCPSRGRKHPFVRFHPMLHSKVYYMELPCGDACVFIGSHNMTSFALTGVNGEAGVLLEGPAASEEFRRVRSHINAARQQSTPYSPAMKEAFAWWTREFIEGLRTEVKIPQDWTAVRTLLIFATTAGSERPVGGDEIYFEIPGGIEQIESLKTEAHLFISNTLPADPWEAINRAAQAEARFACITHWRRQQKGHPRGRDAVAHRWNEGACSHARANWPIPPANAQWNAAGNSRGGVGRHCPL